MKLAVVFVLCVAFAAAAARAEDGDSAEKPAAKDPYAAAKAAGEKALADLEKTPTQRAVDAFNKLQEERKKLNPVKGPKQEKKELPHSSEKLKVPIPIARIHDPYLLKPIHSVFKCDTLLDKTQIARCTECFRKGLPAPWEVIGYQANNAQCRVGHTIIPVALLDAGAAATAASAEQVMAEDAAAEEADDEDEAADEDEADEEDEEADEDEAEEEAFEEDMALLEVADEEEDEAEDEAEDGAEDEAEDEAEAEEEETFDAEEEEEFEDAAADQETAFLELAHAQIDAAYRAFRDENEL